MHISQNPARHHQTGRLGQYGVYYIFSWEYHCFSVERGFRQEKCPNRCKYCCSTGYKCNMVIGILWNTQHFRWSGYGIDPVDININKHHNVLSDFQTCRTDIYSIPHLGKYSILFKLQCFSFKPLISIFSFC